MPYRTLGRTGVQVSSLALGAMTVGKLGRSTQNDVTADMYSGGESEEMVGAAIASRRDDVVLATKLDPAPRRR
ncbi:aldo/keto reductase family protein [Tamaricihabitans halophyticus]|uniref:Aldo/keto reductase family protein n=1 Tax=Tamaricihabitans halophyticus TaxID=1262583 RepID=A0A4R2PSN4_9PSEU|nr:aldo/keto reductase family protein [Tamaricihabitans halophyticus]